MIEEKFKNRRKDILVKVVNCYLKKGEPVASEFLVTRYRLELSPATIRNEFQQLTREGYLYKCHISSGRIPTDKALRYFIDLVIRGKEIEDWKRRWYKRIKERMEILRDFKKTLEFLSKETQSLSFFYFPEEEVIIKKGLKYLFKSLKEVEEEDEKESVERLAESIERFDEEIKKIKVNHWPAIYIGRENPLIRIDNLCFILNQGNEKPLIFGILGNKRMPYERNLGLLEAMAEIF